MTLHEVSTQLYDLAVGHYLNDKKWESAGALKTHIQKIFQNGGLRLKNQYVMSICMMDGRWLMTVNHYGSRPNEYDYTICDTKEQCDALWSRL